VTLTIGGTMVTDILALLTLAAISGMTKGTADAAFWVRLGGSSLVFVGIVFFGFTSAVFKRFTDSVSQYIFVLAMVFLTAFLAEAAGSDAIIGAFFAGLVLNQLALPLLSAHEPHRLRGQCVFHPVFPYRRGYAGRCKRAGEGYGALKVAGIIAVIAIITKYITAKLTQKAFKMTPTENTLQSLMRYDASRSNGIIYSIKEQKITSTLLGLHHDTSKQNLLGPVAEKVLENTSEELFVYQPRQPLNTLTRIVAVVPPLAEQEVGFAHWLGMLRTIAKEAGLPLALHAPPRWRTSAKPTLPIRP
jgi:hypothetical protein